MTVQELMIEVYESSGDYSDLYIYDESGNFDITTDGAVRLLRILNWAQRAVVTWKDLVTGRQLRFKQFYEEAYVQGEVVNETVPDSTSTVDKVSYTTSKADDFYNGYVLAVDSQERLVVDSDSSYLYVGQSLDSAPTSGTSITLHPRYVTIPTIENMIDILEVIDLEEGGSRLDWREKGDVPSSGLFSTEQPSSWRRVASKIYFQAGIDEDRWFQLIAYKSPDNLTSASEEPVIPPQFHYAMVLWALAWAFDRQQDTQMGYSMRRKFHEFMRTTQSEYDIESVTRNEEIRGELGE